MPSGTNGSERHRSRSGERVAEIEVTGLRDVTNRQGSITRLGIERVGSRSGANCTPRWPSVCSSFSAGSSTTRSQTSFQVRTFPVHRDAVQHSTIHSGSPYRRCVARSSPFICTGLLTRTARDLHRLLGMLVFMASLVRRRRLCLLPVRWWTATAWCQRTGSRSDRITVPQWVLSEVAWWASPAVLLGLPLAAKETEVTLFTDASSSGWGAQLGSRSTRGQWSASRGSWHIKALEMQAIINAVRDFLPHLRSWVVRLMCDNAVTVAHIKNEGGTRSRTLMQMTKRLLKWCDSKAITLVPVHLPGVHFIQADSLSRFGQTQTRVDDAHGASTTRVWKVGRAAGRLVCDSRQQTTHQVRIAVSGPQGRVDRCHVHALGQREGPPVRFPAIQDGPSSAAEDRSVTRSQGDFDRSTATGSVVVSGVDGSVPRRTDSAVRWRSRPADSRRLDRWRGDRDSSLPAIKSTRVETLWAILRARGQNQGGPSVYVHTLESQHQGYHEKPHKPMDRGDCQGSLHSSWSGVWPSDSTWGQSAVSFVGVQLSGGTSWLPVSGVLKVIWGLPEFVSTGHDLHCWGHVYSGSSDGRTTSSGSRTSSPSIIAYTICMQPLLRRS